MASTTDWKWSKVLPLFGTGGCSVAGCPFRFDPASTFNYCALNLSDALVRVPYALPAAANVNYCNHQRVRNADGMARICRAQNEGAIDSQGWASRPSWNGIVYFEGGFVGATGHIDLYDGSTRQGLHANYPDATVVWFWKLG
jgi:hypothetical protein